MFQSDMNASRCTYMCPEGSWQEWDTSGVHRSFYSCVGRRQMRKLRDLGQGQWRHVGRRDLAIEIGSAGWSTVHSMWLALLKTVVCLVGRESLGYIMHSEPILFVFLRSYDVYPHSFLQLCIQVLHSHGNSIPVETGFDKGPHRVS
jgi:hypothetical protein